MTSSDNENRRILEEAAKSSSVETIEALLDQVPALEGSEQLVLESAAASGNIAVFQYLLKRNVSIDVKSQSLRVKAICGGVEIWKVLLEHNHDMINWVFGHVADLIGMVVKQGDVSLLAFLLSEGADIEHSHYCYMPVLPFAKAEGASQETIDLLIRYGATMKSSVWDPS